jgi:hypothetical protein
MLSLGGSIFSVMLAVFDPRFCYIADFLLAALTDVCCIIFQRLIQRLKSALAAG